MICKRCKGRGEDAVFLTCKPCNGTGKVVAQGVSDELLVRLKEALGVTITVTLGELGPAPNETGEIVKKILAENDDIALLALGCYLDECRAQGNYEPLKAGVAKIQEHQIK